MVFGLKHKGKLNETILPVNKSQECTFQHKFKHFFCCSLNIIIIFTHLIFKIEFKIKKGDDEGGGRHSGRNSRTVTFKKDIQLQIPKGGYPLVLINYS